MDCHRTKYKYWIDLLPANHISWSRGHNISKFMTNDRWQIGQISSDRNVGKIMDRGTSGNISQIPQECRDDVITKTRYDLLSISGRRPPLQDHVGRFGRIPTDLRYAGCWSYIVLYFHGVHFISCRHVWWRLMRVVAGVPQIICISNFDLRSVWLLFSYTRLLQIESWQSIWGELIDFWIMFLYVRSTRECGGGEKKWDWWDWQFLESWYPMYRLWTGHFGLRSHLHITG